MVSNAKTLTPQGDFAPALERYDKTFPLHPHNAMANMGLVKLLGIC